MNESIQKLLQAETQQFILDHCMDDEHALVLKHKTIAGVPISLVAEQIAGRRKADQKLPKWYHTPGIIFPKGLALEQCSSQSTAILKSSLLQKLCKGNGPFRGLDLSTGFGVDAQFFSQWSILTCVEPDSDLIEISQHNQRLLGGIPSVYKCMDAERFLRQSNDHFDFIYVDPSRRKTGHKVYRLEDCVPNVVGLRDLILERSPLLIIKASPMLDIERACFQLQNVTRVWIISLGNECKELLFQVQPPGEGEAVRTAIEVSLDGSLVWEHSFTPSEEKNAQVSYADPLDYVYEPPVALLKAGAFKWTGAHWNLSKLAPASHLYTSDQLVKDFPGRIFKIVEHYKLDGRLRSIFENGFANVISRNYPLGVHEILKRTGLNEGGKDYLICVSGLEKKFIMKARRIFPGNQR